MKENFRIMYVTFVFQQLIEEVADYLLLDVSLLHTFQKIYYFFLSFLSIERLEIHYLK